MDPSRESIIVNGGQSAVDMFSSDVTIAGFTVQGRPMSVDPSSYPGAGIWLRNGDNVTIERNVIQDNRLGIYMDGMHAGLRIERNAFLRNGAADGAPNGGIFSAGPGLTDPLFIQNLFQENRQFSINIGSASTNLSIERNEGRNEGGTFIVLGRATDASIAFNSLRDIGGSGVFLFGDINGLVIERNRMDTGGGSAVRATAPQFGATTGTTGLIVRYNRFANFGFDGVSLNTTVDSEISNNDLSQMTNSGIRLQDTDNSLISRNRGYNNGKDGINVESLSTGNTIDRNVLSDNAEHDCHDDTTGSGTAGTANTWTDNRGATENRPGLCKAPGRR